MTDDDDHLAERIRSALTGRAGVTERHMFGGLGFMVDGHLAVSASSRGGLMVRVDPAEAEALTRASGVSAFEMRGRPMRGWLHVALSAIGSEEALVRWVQRGAAYAASLPPK